MHRRGWVDLDTAWGIGSWPPEEPRVPWDAVAVDGPASTAPFVGARVLDQPRRGPLNDEGGRR